MNTGSRKIATPINGRKSVIQKIRQAFLCTFMCTGAFMTTVNAVDDCPPDIELLVTNTTLTVKSVVVTGVARGPLSTGHSGTRIIDREIQIPPGESQCLILKGTYLKQLYEDATETGERYRKAVKGDPLLRQQYEKSARDTHQLGFLDEGDSQETVSLQGTVRIRIWEREFIKKGRNWELEDLCGSLWVLGEINSDGSGSSLPRTFSLDPKQEGYFVFSEEILAARTKRAQKEKAAAEVKRKIEEEAKRKTEEEKAAAEAKRKIEEDEVAAAAKRKTEERVSKKPSEERTPDGEDSAHSTIGSSATVEKGAQSQEKKSKSTCTML